MTVLRVLAVFFYATLLTGALREPACARVNHTQSFETVKVEVAPALDASLADPIWKKALVADAFNNFTTRTPAKLGTTAWMLYDDKNLYVGFAAKQTGVPIIATQSIDHAGVVTDDHVTFAVDTSGNGSRVYYFRVNPKGVHSESSSENSRYAPQWDSYSKISSNGDWNVLMVIPLADLRAQSAQTQDWKINFIRFVAATNDQYSWAFEETQSDIDSPQFWPQATGIKIKATAARPQPHADIYALGTSGADRAQFQNGIANFQNTKTRTIGVDVTYPITNTAALVGTLNPDFSNVEQDQTQIAPQEFQRFYNEYRPFFAQGANFINALPNIGLGGPSDSLFYTPSLGIFDRGLKVEGTAGKHAFGILNAKGETFNDTAFGYTFHTRADGALDLSAEGVLANHPGLRDQTLGASLFGTNPHSGVLSALKYSIESGTSVSNPSAAHSLLLTEGIQNAKGVMAIAYQDVGPQYAPADGYTALSDRRGYTALWIYNGVGRGGAVKSYQFTLLGDKFTDYNGSPRQADAMYGYQVTFKNLVSINLMNSIGSLRLYDQGYPVYSNGQNVAFNAPQIQLGYRDGTPSPIDASYSWGRFGGAYLQQLAASTSQKFGQYSLSLEYDGTIEHGVPIFAGPNQPSLNTQWLRRVSLTRSFGANTTLAVGLRGINGMGGFATPGNNLAVSFHSRFKNQDELYLDFGTPAAPTTINRVLFKYVFHAGGGSGT